MSEQRLCIVCQRRELEATQLQTCTTCIGRTRQALLDIVANYALLPAEMVDRAGTAKPMDITGVRGDEDQMPGGHALVLLAGGGSIWREQGGIDSVSGVLGRWEDDLRITLEAPAAKDPFTVTGCSAFLLRALSWMAQHHPAFDEFAKDMRDLRGALERVLRQGDPVVRGKVPCPECGGELRREYAKPDPCPPGCKHNGHGHDQGGQRDHWRCRDGRCRRIVEPAEYWLAVRQAKEAAC